MADKIDVAEGTMIGFSAKREAFAQKDNYKNRLFICTDSKKLIMNKERVGLTDAEATYLANKMKAENQATANSKLTVEITYTPKPFELNGATESVTSEGTHLGTYYRTKITIIAVVKYDGATVQATDEKSNLLSSLKLQIPNTSTPAVTLTYNTSKNYYAYTGEFTTLGTWTLDKVYYRDNSLGVTAVKQQTIAITGGNYIYYGVTTSDGESSGKTLPEIIKAFTDGAKGALYADTAKQTKLFDCGGNLVKSASGTYTFNIPQDGYAYFLIPKYIDLGKFTSKSQNGYYNAQERAADVPFVQLADFKSTSLTTDKLFAAKDITFRVFRLASPQNAGTHTFTI